MWHIKQSSKKGVTRGDHGLVIGEVKVSGPEERRPQFVAALKAKYVVEAFDCSMHC